jgi:hypothetical protein
MQSECNYFDWDYEEVADEKDLIIMKQKRRLEVLTRVSDEQGQQLVEQNEKIDAQNQRISNQKIIALESGLNTCSLVLIIVLMVLMYKMMV